MKPSAILLLLLSSPVISAFTPVRPVRAGTLMPKTTFLPSSTRLRDSLRADPETETKDLAKRSVSTKVGKRTRDEILNASNPSIAFGKPLAKEVEDFNAFTVGAIKGVIFDTFLAGEDRAYARFYALETIARMPYFSYLSVLHLYETLGLWRKANILQIHFAQSWNEMHHLLIMEELGGADAWFDRFLAQSVAVVYYWIVVFMYMINPTFAYNLNQHVEEHAFATYDQFLTEHGDELKQLPAPKVATDYYRDGELYMFDQFHTSSCIPRRPKIDNLYDVFVAVRDDEAEHVKTMTNLQKDVELRTSNQSDDSEALESVFISIEECWKK